MDTRKVYKPKQEDIFELAVPGKTAEDYKNREVIDLNIPVNEFNASPIIKRSEILDFGNEGFLLDDVLTKDECQCIIEKGEEIGFREITVRKDYRNSDRIMVRSPELAQILWNRIHGILDEITIEGDPHSVHIHGIKYMLQGTWKPACLNQMFRLCRYYPGGHFAPHFDGHFVKNSRERSMKTFMLYLNGGFGGATTNFVNEDQQLYMDETGKYCAEEKNVIYRIKPEAGRALCFNHHRLHEGEALKDGVKYILRTDVMYVRDGECPATEAEEKAFQLVQEAERLECSGNNMEAMELYRKAFKMSPSLEESFGS